MIITKIIIDNKGGFYQSTYVLETQVIYTTYHMEEPILKRQHTKPPFLVSATVFLTHEDFH